MTNTESCIRQKQWNRFGRMAPTESKDCLLEKLITIPDSTTQASLVDRWLAMELCRTINIPTIINRLLDVGDNIVVYCTANGVEIEELFITSPVFEKNILLRIAWYMREHERFTGKKIDYYYAGEEDLLSPPEATEVYRK